VGADTENATAGGRLETSVVDRVPSIRVPAMPDGADGADGADGREGRRGLDAANSHRLKKVQGTQEGWTHDGTTMISGVSSTVITT
jgi:hypothetical protein